ncbi:hypothetical protein [Pseudomonas sp. GM48]|uniref:hypothetical protein n=1 Tax=Pseudomonas sp. GM48 TaxID=1144330 RepID=UPI0012F7C75E|nr:hypothetical protein [Pseudomonas sp. GM48]
MLDYLFSNGLCGWFGVVIIVVILLSVGFYRYFYLFAGAGFDALSVDDVLMIAQKILFAVRVVGYLVCDISGVNVEWVNISYVLTE